MTQPLTPLQNSKSKKQCWSRATGDKYLVPWIQLQVLGEISSHKILPFCWRQNGTEIRTEQEQNWGETCRQSIMTHAQFCLWMEKLETSFTNALRSWRPLSAGKRVQWFDRFQKDSSNTAVWNLVIKRQQSHSVANEILTVEMGRKLRSGARDGNEGKFINSTYIY